MFGFLSFSQEKNEDNSFEKIEDVPVYPGCYPVKKDERRECFWRGKCSQVLGGHCERERQKITSLLGSGEARARVRGVTLRFEEALYLAPRVDAQRRWRPEHVEQDEEADSSKVTRQRLTEMRADLRPGKGRRRAVLMSKIQ